MSVPGHDGLALSDLWRDPRDASRSSGNFLRALSWNPLAFLALCGVALFDLYAVIVLLGRAPRLRIVGLDENGTERRPRRDRLRAFAELDLLVGASRSLLGTKNACHPEPRRRRGTSHALLSHPSDLNDHVRHADLRGWRKRS